MTTVMQAL